MDWPARLNRMVDSSEDSLMDLLLGGMKNWLVKILWVLRCFGAWLFGGWHGCAMSTILHGSGALPTASPANSTGQKPWSQHPQQHRHTETLASTHRLKLKPPTYDGNFPPFQEWKIQIHSIHGPKRYFRTKHATTCNKILRSTQRLTEAATSPLTLSPGPVWGHNNNIWMYKRRFSVSTPTPKASSAKTKGSKKGISGNGCTSPTTTDSSHPKKPSMAQTPRQKQCATSTHNRQANIRSKRIQDWYGLMMTGQQRQLSNDNELHIGRFNKLRGKHSVSSRKHHDMEKEHMDARKAKGIKAPEQTTAQERAEHDLTLQGSFLAEVRVLFLYPKQRTSRQFPNTTNAKLWHWFCFVRCSNHYPRICERLRKAHMRCRHAKAAN